MNINQFFFLDPADPEVLVRLAKAAAVNLVALTSQERATILNKIADDLINRKDEILSKKINVYVI